MLSNFKMISKANGEFSIFIENKDFELCTFLKLISSFCEIKNETVYNEKEFMSIDYSYSTNFGDLIITIDLDDFPGVLITSSSIYLMEQVLSELSCTRSL